MKNVKVTKDKKSKMYIIDVEDVEGYHRVVFVSDEQFKDIIKQYIEL